MEDRKLCSNCRYEWDSMSEWPCLDCSKHSLWCHKESEAVQKSYDVDNGKPRLAEVLGVEVGVWFRITGFKGKYCVLDNGAMCSSEVPLTGVELAEIINHPESIIRAPRMTEAELAICKAVGAKWVSRDEDGNPWAKLWDGKPDVEVDGDNGRCFYSEHGACILALVDENILKSVHPGECICVEEAGGDA